jgi:flagella basal body P-ring formation protein FlgA
VILSSLWIVATLSMAVEPSCQPVDSEHILGRDLAAADSRFEIVDEGQDLGFAPEPGVKRLFWPAELSRIAQRNGINVEGPVQQLCFERRTRVLSGAEILKSVQAWAPEPARIELIEQSKFAAPVGALVIPRPAVLHATPDGSVLLRGYVVYGTDRKFAMWARVRFTVERKVAVPTEAIAAGSEVRADQVKMDQISGGIEVLEAATDPDQVVGRVTARRLNAGNPIALAALLKPKQVNSGAVVRVEVQDGATHLSLDGRAETGGRTGDMVTVRNPSSGKAFQARVIGEDAVLVSPRGTHSEGNITK